MNSLLKKFRTDLSQVVLDIIWGAWSQLGVMGHGRPKFPLIVDPEPLLLLTWECGRQDSRVFDEVLDWLVKNGRSVNVVRLASLLKEDQIYSPHLAGAVAAFMVQYDKSPKWRNLAEDLRPKANKLIVPLFERLGKPLESVGKKVDQIFAGYNWARSPVVLRRQSQPIPSWTPAALILKSRAFFGVNIRADAFAWLVAHEHGTASCLARELGYSQRRVQDTLNEMQVAELFQTRRDGNRKEYWLDTNKGWQLLYEAASERARWFNWRAFGRAISVVWKNAFSMKERHLTPYLFESEISKWLAAAQPDFTATGVRLSMRPNSSELLQKLQKLSQETFG
jgi:hypothetical protein